MKRKVLAVITLSALVLCALSGEAFSAVKKKMPRKKSTTPAVSQHVKKPDPHSYRKGFTQDQAEQAELVAKEIAEHVMSDSSLQTDLQKGFADGQIGLANYGEH